MPKSPPPPTLGANIKTARLKANITQLDLAHEIGLSGPEAGAYISRVETGAQEPRLDNLRRIAAALGTTMDNLLGGKK